MKKILIVAQIICFVLTIGSCKKFVDIDGPKTSINSKNAFESDLTALGVITSLYSNLSAANLTGPGELKSLSCIASLSADELIYYNSAGNNILDAYFQNNLTNLNAGGSGDYWGTTYQRLFVVNSALEGLNLSKNLSPKVKQQLIGEVKFMRAFYYFYLVNLYGDVPLVLTSNYSINSLLAKSSRNEIYKQIIVDLKEAENLLSEKYLRGDGVTEYPNNHEERIRPTRWAARAMLARVYLYIEDWPNAEAQSTFIINNTAKYTLEPLDKVFLKNSNEAIWQLQPTQKGVNTQDAYAFILPSSGPSSTFPVYLNNNLIDAFEQKDKRKSEWIGSVIANGNKYYFSYKYRVSVSSDFTTIPTEYHTILRLAEQFLIRAEARTHQLNLTGAKSDLDKIRIRAGLTPLQNVSPHYSQEELLNLILKEKRLEFFTEWGHRWLDLKRTREVDRVMSVITPAKSNGTSWRGFQQYYPISLGELKANPNLTPNPGY